LAVAYTHLPDSLRIIYAELLEQSVHAEAAAVTAGDVGGTFVSKEIRGSTYWYLQRSEGGEKRQRYLGPHSEELQQWVERVRGAREVAAPDERRRRELCAMLAAGGAARETAAVAQTLDLLAKAGLFRVGGVLIGTVAFAAQGTMLGVRFGAAEIRTGDVDIGYDAELGIALASRTDRPDVAKALGGSPLEFLPVPMLDPREPSTSFKVRGRELRVDFLTPLRGAEREGAVRLPALNVAAQPLRFLDYLIEDAVPAVVVGPTAVLVRVPQPARTAFHKLWTAQRRSVAEAAKARKDERQAIDLLSVLLAERPADLQEAWTALRRRHGMLGVTERAIKRLPGELVQALRAALKPAATTDEIMRVLRGYDDDADDPGLR
jgi:hypothetical protein